MDCLATFNTAVIIEYIMMKKVPNVTCTSSPGLNPGEEVFNPSDSHQMWVTKFEQLCENNKFFITLSVVVSFFIPSTSDCSELLVFEILQRLTYRSSFMINYFLYLILS